MPQQIAHRHSEMIRIDLIDVLNPRERGRPVFRQMVKNIEAIGLKRPITVSRRAQSDGSERYALICGQGRLEAFRLLGQTEIPAFVTDAPDDECMVMGLVENVARRRHSSAELVCEIGQLRGRGLKPAQIAARVGMSIEWVWMILALLDKGESRLIQGVEAGLIPLTLAIQISRSSQRDVQRLLTEAYEQGALRGNRLALVRRLLDRRCRSSPVLAGSAAPPRSRQPRKQFTPRELNTLYEREVARQQMLAKNAAYTREVLMFVIQALKELRRNPEFLRLLQSQNLHSAPRVLGLERRLEARP
jgi:ParB family transcriptional regulator, chromosome partitioning protein